MIARLCFVSLLATGLISGSASVLAAPSAASTPSAVTAKVNAPDPAHQVQLWARLFRAGDVAGLAQALVPPSKWEEARLLYELKQLEPHSDKHRAEFAEKLARVTAVDAVDRLMAEIEPELEKARPQLPGALMMGFGAAQVALASPETKLSEEQRAALQRALPGVYNWANSTDFLSSERMREALTLLTDAARATGIDNIEQFKDLPLEALLERGRPVLAAAKQAVRLYGLDLDAMVDSLRVEVLALEGDTARVRTTITLFDAPVWGEIDLVLVEGRWYGKASIES